MLNLEIKLGTEIREIEEQIVKIKVPHTKFSIIGEKTEKSKWNVFIWNPDTQQKNMIKKSVTTTAFALCSNIVLKTPFPYEGKDITVEVITRYIKKITKKNKTNGNNINSISISKQGSRI